MKYKTLLHIHSNETGDRQVEIIYKNGVWRNLLHMPEKKETYVSEDGNTWYCKGNRECVGRKKEVEIRSLVQELLESSYGKNRKNMEIKIL